MKETPSNVEWLEAAAWSDMLEAIPRDAADRLGAAAGRIGATRILRVSGIDHLLFNRAIGLGIAERVTRETVDQVVDAYRRVGVARYFVHVTPGYGPPELSTWLEARGLCRYPRRWVKLVRGAEPVAFRSPTDLTIRRADAEDSAAVGHLLASAFDVPEEGAVVFSSLVGRPRWHVYVAIDSGAVVATGALFVEGSLGYVAFAATGPEFRRRGAHRALLSRRLSEGLSLGCRAFVCETGEAVSGDPQHSYNNLVKAGFRDWYLRDNFAPRGVRWGRAA